MFSENQNKYKNGFTRTPNAVLSNSDIPYKARFLFILLRMHCFEKNECFPSEKLLAKEMGKTDRYIRTILPLLAKFNLIKITFRGHNGKSNLYTLPTFNPIQRNNSSSSNKYTSYRKGPTVPVSIGTIVPANKNQLIRNNNKENKYKSSEGYKKCLEVRNKILVKKN